MERILEVRRVKKVFGPKLVLNDITFSLKRGEVLGVVGRSGCGKSTLAGIIAGLLPADGGQIILEGLDITKAKAKEMALAYEKMQLIFQSPEEAFNPRKTLGWSIGEALRNRRCERGVIERQTDALLRATGLTPAYKDRYPHEVSGGECQRAAIARALILSPDLLICDEMTSALDATMQAQIIKLLRQMVAENELACLFITHDLALLPQIAHRVMVLGAGQIAEIDTPENLLANPRSPYTAELVEAALWTQRSYAERIAFS